VKIERAHNNFHTEDGRYSPFAKLLRSYGYREGFFNDSVITELSLESRDVLVIANPVHAANAEL